MFERLKPLIRIGKALERIAHALEYFAMMDARVKGAFFVPGGTQPTHMKGDESELLHTDSAVIDALREQELDQFMQHGYPVIEEDYEK